MSSSFLPFVVDDAKAITIFRSLVQRSKGVPLTKLSVIFSTILSVGLKSVRKSLDEMDSNLTSSAKMALLISKNQDKALTLLQLEYWGYISEYLVDSDSIKKLKLTDSEFKAFFSVLAVKRPEQLKEIEVVLDPSELQIFTGDLRDLKFLKFSEKAEKVVGFTKLAELSAYTAIIESRKVETVIKPILLNVNTQSDRANAYIDRNCESPYK